MTDANQGPESSAQTSLTDRFKAEAERAKNSVADVRGQISEAIDERRGGKATSVDDATTKLEELRRGMDRDIAALSARAPRREELVRQVAPVGAGIVAAVGVLGGGTKLAKKRGAKRRHERGLRQQAEAVAAAIQRLDEPEEESSGRGWLGILGLVVIGAVAAGAAVILRDRGNEDDGPPPINPPLAVPHAPVTPGTTTPPSTVSPPPDTPAAPHDVAPSDGTPTPPRRGEGA